MIELYYWTTPNGHKITIFLEEAEIPYTIHPVNIGRGEQFKPGFLAISPNNRIPAIIDRAPADGRTQVLEWLFWQVGNLGPMAGQNHHFRQYAPEKITYAIERYENETHRLYTVLNKRLAGRPFIAGEYSIADMASYPWIVPHEAQGQKLEDFPHLKRWFEAVAARPAVRRAYARAAEINKEPLRLDEQSRKILFGQKGRP